MKKILWKRITLLFKNRRIGDFVCNFTAVVLGIILTFMGSDWIEKRNTQRDVKSALHLVKAELQTNRETILGGKQRVEREIRAAQFLLRNMTVDLLQRGLQALAEDVLARFARDQLDAVAAHGTGRPDRCPHGRAGE